MTGEACTERVLRKVELALALARTGVSLLRRVLKEQGLECHVYPLPPWDPRPKKFRSTFGARGPRRTNCCKKK